MEAAQWSNPASDTTPRVSLGSYLDFQIRHHLLIVAIPMTLILFAADLTRGYETALRTWFRWWWAPDAALGVAAAAVFVAAPLLLCRIWRTEPLEPGPLRTRLYELCERIGLRCRGILIWRSDGLMVNAAVMGIFAPVRFVLLSDALIAAMSPRQIEAVFGHEAGHVRHRHIQHFLVFAFVGWLVVAGVMELLARVTTDANGASGLSTGALEGVGVLSAIIFWGVCFGWVSRRYERQADLFGARCAAPPAAECTVPCGVHVDESTVLADPDRVCATGAAVFASALERVAALNGIPTDERSWRHSSISSRVRFLMSVAGDSERARRFERTVRRIQRMIWMAAILGAGLAAWYCSVVPQPAVLRMTAGPS